MSNPPAAERSSEPDDTPDAGARRPAQMAGAQDPRVLAFRELLGIVDRLREPDGCPWDRKQTEASMAPHAVEEAHELIEAIESGDAHEAAEEAGDLLLCVAMVCRIAQEAGRYDLARAAQLVNQKLVRRHPHVFAAVSVDSSEEVLSNWEEIKKVERQAKSQDASALAGVPRALPAMQRARRLSEKAIAAGFKWRTVRGAFDKVSEELNELREVLPDEALDAEYKPRLEPQTRKAIEHELGDLLMAAAFFGQYLGVDPEALTRSALRRFESRFRSMESTVEEPLSQAGLETMMSAWRAAKMAETTTRADS